MGVYVMMRGYIGQHLSAHCPETKIPVPIHLYQVQAECAFFWRRPIFDDTATLYAVTEHYEQACAHLTDVELLSLCEQSGAPPP